MKSEKRAIMCAAVAVLSWSTVATAFKIAGQYMTPFVMVLVSTVASFAILGIVVTLQGKLPMLAGLTGRQWGAMALIGLINPVIYYLILFMSYALLPAQIAQPVNYTWAILLLILLAIFGKQRIPGYKYIGMVISFGGLTLISLGGKSLSGGVSVEGIALGLLSALFWATYWLLNKRLCSEIDTTLCFFGAFMFGALYMGIASLAVGIPVLSLKALLSGAYIGCFEMAVPFVFFGMALRLTDNPSLINQMCYLSPFLSLFFISTVLGEPILLTTYTGLILIIGGIVFNELYDRHTEKRKNDLIKE